MLIIFDLDDTLIDTSACVGPAKLKDALNVMITHGLKVPSEKEAVKKILEINSSSKSGGRAIIQFCQEMNQEQFAEVGIKEYYENIDPMKIDILALPHAKELLTNLHEQGHILTVVTYGHKKQQEQKLQRAMQSAGVDMSLFTKIYTTPQKNKGEYYSKLIEEIGKSEEIVIGDNLERDIMPAKKLGIKTIHFRNGRGKHIQYTEQNRPSFSINSLKGAIDIINKLK